MSTEPVLIAGAIAAVLNVLVATGVIDSVLSDALQAAAIALVNVAVIFFVRQRVVPTVQAEAAVTEALYTEVPRANRP